MNSKIIGAIIGVAVLIGAAVFFSPFDPELTVEGRSIPKEVALSADEAGTAESGGCPIGGSGQCQADSSHQPSTPATNSTVISSESTAGHDFTLEKLGGGTITLAQYRSQKPVIVDFWASWCPNCRRDMPKLNKWYEQYCDQVEVIGVNLQEDSKTVEQFIQNSNIAFPIALDPTGVASATFGIQFTNTHFLFNKAGELVRVIPGDIKESDIVSLLES